MLCSLGQHLGGQGIILTNPSDCQLNLPIADNQCPDGSTFSNPNQFGIQVTQAGGNQLGGDVYLAEVRLIIEHSWVGDLEVQLRSPGGREIELLDDIGGNGNNFGDPTLPNCIAPIRLNSSACTSIRDREAARAPDTDQTYLPIQSLFSFNDGSDPNGLWVLSICDDLEEDTGVLQYVELVFHPISCLPITELVIADQDSTSVVLDWTDQGDCSQGQTLIEYGPPGFTPGTDDQPGTGGSIILADCPPYILQGLDPETTYDLYIRKQCGPNTFSDNTCGTSITTGCLPPGPSITEDFDEEIVCSTRCERSCTLNGLFYNVYTDDIDWIAYTGATPTLETGPETDVSGDGNYVYLESSGSACPAGSQAILRSDCFEFSGGGADSCHLSFHYYMNGFDVGDLSVAVSANGGLSWQVIWSASGDQGDRWQRTYLSLGFLPKGATLQIQFIADKLGGPLGDIALDEISLHGSRHLGRPDQVFYADLDGDGFGDEGRPFTSCLATPPPGYVAIGGDCDDSRADVNPDQEEIPCDNLDNNCNGIADDRDLPPPLVQNDTICSGETPLLIATPVSGKSIFWYTQPEGFDDIPAFGEIYTPDLPPNNTGEPQIYRFYAEETDIVCFSAERAEAVVVVLPSPAGLLAEAPTICPGSSIDLADLPIEDRNQTNATIRFFEQFPLVPENQLENTEVQPNGPNSYFYEMTSEAACTFTGIVPVGIHPKTQLQFTPGPAFSLCEGSGQVIEVLPSGGTAPYQYFWNTGEETASIQIEASTEAGSTAFFSVSVTDNNQCTSEDSIAVLTTTSIDSINRSTTDVTACNLQDGSLSIEPLSGVAPFTYSWSGTNGSSGDSTVNSNAPVVFQHLAQGAYRVTITDGSTKGCTFRMPPAYINGPAAEVRRVDIQNVSCLGADDGQINLSVRGNPSYSWNDGGNTRDRSGLAPGFYSVTLTEGTCETVVDSILIESPDRLKVQIATNIPSCHDSNDGQIALTAFGGNGNYQYQWSQGSITSAVNDLSQGNYQVTVSDQNGCQLMQSIPLTAPAPLGVNIDTLQAISCAGAEDGQIQLSATGGTEPYQYQWNTGAPSNGIQNLTPGTYNVTIQDKNECRMSRTFTILEPDSVQLETRQVIPPDCVGDTSGVIAIAATGGRGNYRFSWNNGVDSSFNDQLGVGIYTARAFDENGCPSPPLDVELTAVSNLNFVLSKADATCEGRSDGVLRVQPSGIFPFQYAWSTGDSTAQISQLTSGSYTLTLTDGAGCLIDTSFQIENSSQPIQASFNILAPQCANTDDALINVNLLEAPNQPISYQWNDGAFIRDRTNIPAGSYQVTITDGIGCRYVSDSLLVADTPPLEITLVSEGAIRCQGDTNGFLEIAVDGGTGPYQYNWIGVNSSSNTARNLAAGTYQVFVQDANGCPANATYTIAEPPLLQIELDVEIGNICLGDSSNLLAVRASGGQPPYRFQWNNGAQDSVIQNLLPGDYGVVVRDANQCQETIPAIKVREPGSPLILENFQTTDISCFGRRDGSMEAEITGGTAPFTYVFSNSRIIQTNEPRASVEGLAADDDYQVIVFDAQGCVVRSVELAIQEPELLSVRRDSIKDISCAGQADGAIYVTPSGGRTPYAYLWLDSLGREVSELQDLRFAPAGTYQLVVADNDACLDTLRPSTIRDFKTPLEIANIDIQNVQCAGDENGSIRVSPQGGTPPYNYIWNTGQRPSEISGLEAGFYAVTVTDQEKCRLILDSLVVLPSSSLISIEDSIVDVSCFGLQDGLLSAKIAGGIPPYQTSWEQSGHILELDTSILDNLAAGDYQFRVIDSLGCSNLFHLSVKEPLPLQLDFITEAPDSIANNGQISALVNGGTPPYQYFWNTGDSLAILDSLSAGNYTLEVLDTNGCLISDNIQLIATQVLAADMVEQIRLFPNPSRGESLLEIKMRNRTELELRIYTENGQLIQKTKLGRQQFFRGPIQLQQSGKYLIRLQDSKGRLLYTSWLFVTAH
jgi:subtilisin-like proprotein convertase family protein